jgi:hypothetical protein
VEILIIFSMSIMVLLTVDKWHWPTTNLFLVFCMVYLIILMVISKLEWNIFHHPRYREISNVAFQQNSEEHIESSLQKYFIYNKNRTCMICVFFFGFPDKWTAKICRRILILFVLISFSRRLLGEFLCMLVAHPPPPPHTPKIARKRI